jgi:hypothetical protein
MVSIAVWLLALVPAVCGEEAKTVRVCIPQHTANNAQLHQVEITLTNHKPDKASHIRVQGVQLANVEQVLDTDNPYKGNLAIQTLTREAQDRARQEQCDYVLVVAFPDVKTARSAQPSASSPNQQATTNTYDPYMRRQDPENYVQVKYHLYRLDPAASLDGFVSTHDAAPAQAVVSIALDMLANQVFTKVAK